MVDSIGGGDRDDQGDMTLMYPIGEQLPRNRTTWALGLVGLTALAAVPAGLLVWGARTLLSLVWH